MASKDAKKPDIKIIILGPASVGKTCLMQRYTTGEFNDKTEPSMGAALAMKNWGSLKVALWDTAGEEKFAAISALYCRGASAAILAYDITDKSTFESLKDTYIPLLENANKTCLVVIVGCKCDRIKSVDRKVTQEEGRELAAKQHEIQLNRAQQDQSSSVSFLDTVDGSKSFFETSALTGENVTATFDYLKGIFSHSSSEGGAHSSQPSGTVQVSGTPRENATPKKSCCS